MTPEKGIYQVEDTSHDYFEKYVMVLHRLIVNNREWAVVIPIGPEFIPMTVRSNYLRELK